MKVTVVGGASTYTPELGDAPPTTVTFIDAPGDVVPQSCGNGPRR